MQWPIYANRHTEDGFQVNEKPNINPKIVVVYVGLAVVERFCLVVGGNRIIANLTVFL